MSRLARSAGVIGVATMTSRLLGLLRDQVLAYLFGAADAMDAFRIAFRLPNVLRDLFAEGALSAAIVPTLARGLDRDRRNAFRLVSTLINAVGIASVVVVIAGMLLAQPLVELYAGRFREVPGKLELTVRLTRVMFPFLTLVSVAAVLMGTLNALHRFFLPALSPAMFNIATILSAVTLVPLAPALGLEPITAIATGTLLGGAGQILLQWPALRREGFRYTPAIDLQDRRVREIAALMVPGVVGLAAVQVNLLVNSWLAAGLGTGAVSWLDYAFRLMYLPIGLFGMSIATASLPNISRHAAHSDRAALRGSVSAALRMMLVLNVPATFGLVTLASPIVVLIFEHGRFTARDTEATAAALACYAPGLVGYSAVKLISPTFYALGSSRIPAAASGASVAVNIMLNLVLVRVLGHSGLALGTSVSALLNAGLLVWLLRDRLGRVDGRRVAVTFVKITMASLVMAAAAHRVERTIRAAFGSEHVLAQVAAVFGAILVGLVVLAAAARLLRLAELNDLKRALTGSPPVERRT